MLLLRADLFICLIPFESSFAPCSQAGVELNIQPGLPLTPCLRLPDNVYYGSEPTCPTVTLVMGKVLIIIYMIL